MSIEAMKQALEALESATPKYTRQRADQKTLGGALDYWKLEQHQRLKAITSLRQAIAEAEKQEQGEFVAKHYVDGGHLVYPPQQRTWVELNHDEVPEQFKDDSVFIEGWLWAEAKLKEKNT